MTNHFSRFTKEQLMEKLSINDQLTVYYFFIDNFFKEHPGLAQWRQSNYRIPAFTDAEVITIAMMQGYFQCATLKQAYLLVRANANAAFPQCCGYKQWLARLHQLSPCIGALVLASSTTPDTPTSHYVMDSKPLPLCHPLRHGRVSLLREDGAYFGKTKKGWFFGFKLHAIVNPAGLVIGAILTPANTDDRDPALALAWSTEGGLVLGDLGYRSEELRELLAEEADLLLLTPADAPRPQKALLSSLRERVETSFSQLWSRFVDLVYSRSWNGLWNTVKLKMLHFNLTQSGRIPA
jgi:transposase